MRSLLVVIGVCSVKRYINGLGPWRNQGPFIILIKKRVEHYVEV